MLKMISKTQRVTSYLTRPLLFPQAKVFVMANILTNVSNQNSKLCNKDCFCSKPYDTINHCSTHQKGFSIDFNELCQPLCKGCKQALLNVINEKRFKYLLENPNVRKTLCEDYEPETMVKYYEYGFDTMKYNSSVDSHLTKIPDGISLSGVAIGGLRQSCLSPQEFSCAYTSPYFHGATVKQPKLKLATGEAADSSYHDHLEDTIENQAEFLKIPGMKTAETLSYQSSPKIARDSIEQDWFDKTQKSNLELNDNNEYIIPYSPKSLVSCENNFTINPTSTTKNGKLDENTAQKIYNLVMRPKNPEVIFPHFLVTNKATEYFVQHLKTRDHSNKNNTKETTLESLDD